MRKISIILITIIAACLLVRPVLGATVSLELKTGFGGYLVPGTVMPVVVELNRPVPAGRLEIISSDQEGAFSVVDSFSVQNWKRIEASVFIKENTVLKVRLFSAGKLLVETGLDSETKIFPGNLVLAVKTQASVEQAIESALHPAEPVLVTPVEIADFPGTPLNYDGVSGIILSDPGPVFTPLQVQALKAWLAGGGRLVLDKVRSGQNSLLAALGIQAANSERSYYPVGFGGITAFRDELAGLNPTSSQWRDLLNLDTYTETTRLTVNKIFPQYQTALSPTPSEGSSQAAFYLAMVLISWVVSGLLLIIPAKGNRILIMVCFTLFWTGAAFPVGNWLAGAWNRGAEIQSRAILLPEGWMLTDVKVRFTPFKIVKSINLQPSPWGGRVFLGEESYGMLKGRDRTPVFSWNHSLSQSNTSVQDAAPGFASFNGWFFNPALNREGLNRMELEEILRPNGEAVIWNGRGYYRARDFLSKGDWEGIEEPPAWLLEENNWLTRLNRINPGQTWLIGRGSLSGRVLKIEKKGFNRGLWALPVPEEVRK